VGGRKDLSLEDTKMMKFWPFNKISKAIAGRFIRKAVAALLATIIAGLVEIQFEGVSKLGEFLGKHSAEITEILVTILASAAGLIFGF
jgi:hypothetical protein